MKNLAIIAVLFACQALADVTTMSGSGNPGTTQAPVVGTTVSPSAPTTAATSNPTPPPPPATTQAPLTPSTGTTAAAPGATTNAATGTLYLTNCFFGPLPVYTTGVQTTASPTTAPATTAPGSTAAPTTVSLTTESQTTQSPPATTAPGTTAVAASTAPGTTALVAASTAVGTTGVQSPCTGTQTCTPQMTVTSGTCTVFVNQPGVSVSAAFWFSLDNTNANVILYDNLNCNATGATVRTFSVVNNACKSVNLPSGAHNFPVNFKPSWSTTPATTGSSTTGVSAAAFSAPSVFVALFAVVAALFAVAL